MSELAGFIYFACSWPWFSKQASTCAPLSAPSQWLKPLQLGRQFLIANNISTPSLGHNSEDMMWATPNGVLAEMLPILGPIFHGKPSICKPQGRGMWLPSPLCSLTSAHLETCDPKPSSPLCLRGGKSAIQSLCPSPRNWEQLGLCNPLATPKQLYPSLRQPGLAPWVTLTSQSTLHTSSAHSSLVGAC